MDISVNFGQKKQMNRSDSAALPIPAIYDDCRIISCLKKLFASGSKRKVKTNFIVYNNIAEIRKELKFVNKKGILELSWDYLAAMEQSLPNVVFRYVVISRNNEAILFASFQLFTLTSRSFNLEKNKGFVKRILRFFLDIKKVSVLISGNALRNDTAGFCFNENILSVDEAAEIIASAGEKIAADEKAVALLLKDIPVTANTHQWFANAGFETPWKDMVMAVDIRDHWITLADYIADLSRKYKTRAKKILASGNKLTIKNLQQDDMLHNNKEIYRLFMNVADNQSFVLTKPGKDHFSLLYFTRDKLVDCFYQRIGTSS